MIRINKKYIVHGWNSAFLGPDGENGVASMEEENSRPFGALRFYIMVRFEFLMLYKILNGKSHVTCDSCNII